MRLGNIIGFSLVSIFVVAAQVGCSGSLVEPETCGAKCDYPTSPGGDESGPDAGSDAGDAGDAGDDAGSQFNDCGVQRRYPDLETMGAITAGSVGELARWEMDFGGDPHMTLVYESWGQPVLGSVDLTDMDFDRCENCLFLEVCSYDPGDSVCDPDATDYYTPVSGILDVQALEQDPNTSHIIFRADMAEVEFVRSGDASDQEPVQCSVYMEAGRMIGL